MQSELKVNKSNPKSRMHNMIAYVTQIQFIFSRNVIINNRDAKSFVFLLKLAISIPSI